MSRLYRIRKDANVAGDPELRRHQRDGTCAPPLGSPESDEFVWLDMAFEPDDIALFEEVVAVKTPPLQKRFRTSACPAPFPQSEPPVKKVSE